LLLGVLGPTGSELFKWSEVSDVTTHGVSICISIMKVGLLKFHAFVH